MGCPLTRKEVREIVLNYLHQRYRRVDITEQTYLEEEIGADRLARRGYLPALRRLLRAAGCRLSREVTGSKFEDARTVRRLVTVLYQGLKK